MESYCYVGIFFIIVILVVFAMFGGLGYIISFFQAVIMFFQWLLMHPEAAVMFFAFIFIAVGIFFNSIQDFSTAKLSVSAGLAIGGWGEVPMPRIPMKAKYLFASFGTISPLIVYFTDWIIDSSTII